MLKFFRKIRQNLLAEGKTVNYLKYAVGEIVLVVIGILIALSINNWNEERTVQIGQKSLLINLYENLAADSVLLEQNKEKLLKIIETHKQLYAYRKGLIPDTAIVNPESIRGSIRIYSITKSNNPEIAIKVFNETLKERIREYYKLLTFLENSYTQYDDVVKQSIRPYLAQNLVLNPDYVIDNKSKLNLQQFYLIVKRDDFGQILFESDLKAKETIAFFDDILTANAALRVYIKKEIN